MAKKALIVDDSRTAFMVLARVLANYNIEGIHAKSGDEALSYLKDHKVDVIFLDQAMPGKDGFETIKEIKHSSDLKNIPVMMFTARSGEQYHQEIKELGAVGVLPKELSAEEVEEALIRLNLWGAISGQTKPEKVETDILQPTADEKLRVWLESFLENEFSPQLSNKVRKATDDLRRDTIHYGKRMLDEIAKTDRQQQVLQEVKGQTDYLKQLFATSFKQYRFISMIFITLLVILTAGIVWLLYQTKVLASEQASLEQLVVKLSLQNENAEKRLADKMAQQSMVVEQLVDWRQQEQDASVSVNDSFGLYSSQGMVGKVVGMEKEGNVLTAKSAHGYLFAVTSEGRIADNDLKQYFIEPGCNGTAYANALPGMVLRIGESRLGYTELQGQTLVQVPVSWMDSSAQCHQYTEQNEMILRVLIDNDERITGVSDTVYFQMN